MVTYDKITEAYNRIFPYIIKKPIIRLEQLDEIVDNLNKYLHPYEDEDIIAGYSTLGIEINNEFQFDKIVPLWEVVDWLQDYQFP